MLSPAARQSPWRQPRNLLRKGRRKLRHWLCWLVRLQLQMCVHWPREDPRTSGFFKRTLRAACTEPLAVLVGEGAAVDLRAVPQRLAALEAARPAALVGADGVVASDVPACPLPAINREPCRERPKGLNQSEACCQVAPWCWLQGQEANAGVFYAGPAAAAAAVAKACGLTLVDCGDGTWLIRWLTPAHAVVPVG